MRAMVKAMRPMPEASDTAVAPVDRLAQLDRCGQRQVYLMGERIADGAGALPPDRRRVYAVTVGASDEAAVPAADRPQFGIGAA